jgi:WD40 repeat protein
VCGTAEGFSHVPLRHADNGSVEFGTRVVIDATPDSYLRDMSDDGTKLVIVSPRRGLVKIFTLAADGTPTLATEWTVPGPYGAAFGRDGAQLLINHDDTLPNFPGATLRVWDIATGQPLRTLEAPISADADWNDSADVAITSNGREESLLWRAGTWTRGASLPPEVQGNFTCFAIAPDGKLVAIGTGAGVHLIDVATGRTLAVLNRGPAFGYANAVRFSPDGATVAAVNGDALVHLWHLPSLRAELAKLGLDW